MATLSFPTRFAPLLAVAFTFALAMGNFANAEEEPSADGPKKETVISLSEGAVTLKAPPSWEVKKPQTRIVDYEFSVPPAEGDELPGRVTVMGAGGGVEANIERWIKQFEQPDGGNTKDVAKIEEQEVGGTKVHKVSITGNYKDQPGGGPFTRTPVVLREDYRMLAAIIETEENGHYFVKLYGPRKTVDAQEEVFQKMIESLEVKDVPVPNEASDSN